MTVAGGIRARSRTWRSPGALGRPTSCDDRRADLRRPQRAAACLESVIDHVDLDFDRVVLANDAARTADVIEAAVLRLINGHPDVTTTATR